MRIDAGHPCIAGCGAFRAPRNAQTTPDEDSIRTRSAPQQHGAAGTQSTCRLRSPGTAVSSPRAGAGSQASALGPRDPDFRRLRCPVAGEFPRRRSWLGEARVVTERGLGRGDGGCLLGRPCSRGFPGRVGGGAGSHPPQDPLRRKGRRSPRSRSGSFAHKPQRVTDGFILLSFLSLSPLPISLTPFICRVFKF